MQKAVAVVGAGIAGAAAAYELALRGCAVHVFDQYPFHHAHGSSHGPTRLFRLAYFEHPNYVPLLRLARDGWRSLEQAVGQSLFIQSGVIECGQPHNPLVADTVRAAELHGLELETLDAKAAQRRCPQIQLTDDMTVLIEEAAGFVLADRALSTYLDITAARGGVFHPHVQVQQWEAHGDGVRLHTDRGIQQFDAVVAAPGPWATKLLGPSVPVRVLEKPLFWFKPGAEGFRPQDGFCSFAIEQPDLRFFYGFPAIDQEGVKLGEHTGGREIASPDRRLGYATDDERDDARKFVATYLPGLSPTITREETCLYEMSPDGHFMIDRHPACEKVCFAAGLSGHGFKFAPIIGQLLADMVMERDPNPNAEFLKLSRFPLN